MYYKTNSKPIKMKTSDKNLKYLINIYSGTMWIICKINVLNFKSKRLYLIIEHDV